MADEILSRGAEAVISRENGHAVKERVAKGYRLRAMDEKLRKRRTSLEARLLAEARRASVHAPAVCDAGEYKIKMEFVAGDRVKEILGENNFREIAAKIADAASKLHENGIIHGDLTTSNMIMKDDALYLIDFGLGSFSKRTEDKAVDMHLLAEALKSTHPDLADGMWQIILKKYAGNYEDAKSVIKAVEKIEKRGRYVKR